jgi:hypothetical protein
MRIRPERIPTAIEVRAVYNVVELARVAGVSPHMMHRLLEDNGVTILRAGRIDLVPLCDIEARIPPLWQSIVAAERLRADARAAASAARVRGPIVARTCGRSYEPPSGAHRVPPPPSPGGGPRRQ